MNKIAIISDTHNNYAIAKKIVEILKSEKINFIIHCGDIGEPDYLKEAFKGFKVRAVLGNMDEGYGSIKEYQKPPEIIVCEKTKEEEINGKKIAFNHFPKEAKELAKTGKYDFVFYGHTHKPWEEKVGSCILLNPGNATGTFYKATFAIYDFKSGLFTLKIL
ncbi:MAG: metallophosphoesterase family protein [Candidatus Pacebacteria bacterium]|nr:metallophosphoesterase family protein [Candidatus Paceibacterota bacterium]MDD3729126.1 metallophosphoesterase family protein [Candidatus Paceibacterota bacterium]MDD4201222.1 metallophosphoesterase family protein [Candidatus Paceibacterota bacterium]MDD4897441.1 metallophosphoesterase family protein [Candidatus Paceibacterota bacterium]MDD5446077.1 metallophosphoesterase family protein [Candidatus Paceibacterota bacterium]